MVSDGGGLILFFFGSLFPFCLPLTFLSSVPTINPLPFLQLWTDLLEGDEEHSREGLRVCHQGVGQAGAPSQGGPSASHLNPELAGWFCCGRTHCLSTLSFRFPC
jgi:hypothetical protein